MVQIVGKYQHQSNEGFDEFLTAAGAPAAEAKKFADSKPVLEVKEAGDSWTVVISNEGKDSTSTFKLGEAYDETMPNGIVFKSVTVREGDKFITTTELPGGNQSIRVYEFSDAGIVVHLSDKKSGKTAKRTYKRI